VREGANTGLLGAGSLVGRCVILRLIHAGRHTFAFSRTLPDRKIEGGVTWLPLPVHASAYSEAPRITIWLCVAPIWILPQYFSMLEAYGACRVIAISSTSVFVKDDSSDPGEQDIARRLAEGERALRAWAESRGVEWVIIRPTLIYGRGRDKNISEMAGFVRRWGCFPLLGRANGLRQPIHAEDVAAACVSALTSSAAANRAYNLSGGEALPYREMVCRVFAALGKRPRLVNVPLWIFRVAVTVLHLVPRYRHWTAEMAERMNRDLVFDHADAMRDLHFSPRPFQLSPEDLPA
jgi:nucleoside-diphosphate-sugar epimerase